MIESTSFRGHSIHCVQQPNNGRWRYVIRGALISDKSFLSASDAESEALDSIIRLSNLGNLSADDFRHAFTVRDMSARDGADLDALAESFAPTGPRSRVEHCEELYRLTGEVVE